MIRVNRSYPAPSSLATEASKASGAYNLPDVTERLRKDFFDKCYICEIKPVSDPEVEHRLPHKGNTIPGRKYDWDNLFWSCRHCNLVKTKAKYDIGILDCCKQDPEEYLMPEVKGREITVGVIDIANKQAKLTAELIEEAFNKTDTGIRLAACDARRDLLQKEMSKLYKVLSEYKQKPDSKLNQINLRVLLRRESAFASFKRYYAKSHQHEYPDLDSYID